MSVTNPDLTVLHPQTQKALESIDAEMFTGDPGESADRWAAFDFYMQRWVKQMAKRKPRLDGSLWWETEGIDT